MDRPPLERPAWRTCGILAVSVAVATLACRYSKRERSPAARPVPAVSGSHRMGAAEKDQRAEPHEASPSVAPAGDGTGLWLSPTQGHPVALAYLPVGTEMIAVLRPADILTHPEGAKTAELLGPYLGGSLSQWQQELGIPWERIEQITVGMPSAEAVSTRPTCVIVSQTPLDAWRQQRLDAGVRIVHHGADEYFVHDRTAFFLPTDAAASTLIVCPAEEVRAIVEAGQTPPPLRRSVERLVSFTDADRLATVVFPPTYLSAALTPYFGDGWPRMKQSLDWLLGHDIRAIHMSLHVDEHLFIELQVAGALHVSLSKWAAAAPARLDKILDQLARRYASLDRETYGFELLEKGPDMLAAVSAHTRVLELRDHVVMRCYLPSVAAHNLAALAMLSLNGL